MSLVAVSNLTVRFPVYGVDERFWRFHGVEPIAIEIREAVLSEALAREVGAKPGAAVLVRVQRPSDIPLESLHSRKDEVGRTLRLTTRSIIGPASLGEFSLDAQQGDVMAVFVPLGRLREELEVGERGDEPAQQPRTTVRRDGRHARGVDGRRHDDGRVPRPWRPPLSPSWRWPPANPRPRAPCSPSPPR